MTDPSQPISGVRSPGLVLLLLILVLAAAVRLWNIGQRSLWLDEYLTLGGSNSQIYSQFDLPNGQVVEHPPDYISLSAAPPWYYIWTRAQGEVHPPLFYLTLRIWRNFVPDTDSWLRILSTVFALVSVAMLYICINTQAGQVPALWASLLMALAGVQIDYSQEVRSYTMLLAALLMACAGMLQIERFGFNTRRALLLGSGSLLAVLTHYLAIPILVIVALYGLIRLRGEQRKRTMLTFFVAGIVFCILWGPFAFQQRHGFMDKLSHTIDPAWAAQNWLMRVAELPGRFLINVPPEYRGILAISALLYVLPLFFLRRNSALLLWTMILILGAGVDAASDLYRHGKMLDTARYTIPVSISIYPIAGLLLAHVSGWLRNAVPAAIALVCLIMVPQAYTRFKADWRGMGAFIHANFNTRDVLIMNDPIDPADPEFFDWRIRADYLSMNYYVRGGFPAIVFLSTPPTDQVRQRISQGQTIWLFTSFTNTEKNASFFPAARFTPALRVEGVGQLEKLELPGAPSTSAGQGN